jgi:1-phosphatidylinositol-4-phosphate 5-kinase
VAVGGVVQLHRTFFYFVSSIMAATWSSGVSQHLSSRQSLFSSSTTTTTAMPSSQFQTARNSLTLSNNPSEPPSPSIGNRDQPSQPDTTTTATTVTTTTTTAATATAAIQEVHIIQLRTDTVQLEPGSVNTFVHKPSHSLATSSSSPTIAPEAHAGPPPPSPPASIDREDEGESSVPSTPSRMPPSTSRLEQAIVTFDGSVTQRQSPSPIRRAMSAHAASPSVERTGSDTKLPIPTPSLLRTRDNSSTSSFDAHTPVTATAVAAPSSSSSHDCAPAHGYLQPPPPPSIFRERPPRRNTTGSSPRIQTQHAKHGSQPFTFYEEGDVGGGSSSELAPDIQIHAAQIRRERQERQSKRAKAQEAEAALTRPREEENGQGVGKLIGEGHVNYVLMYNMLTGIRIGVSLLLHP